MKRTLLFMTMLCTLGLTAHAQPADFAPNRFLNQYEISVSGAASCQAVQITKDWFLTAAHCVSPLCEKSCKVSIYLTQGSASAEMRVYHSSDAPTVFVYPGYRRGVNRSSNVDVALIYLRPDRSKLDLTDGLTGVPLTMEAFEEHLRSDDNAGAHWDSFLNPPRAVFLTFPSGETAQLKGPVAVPELEANGLRILQSGGNGVFYVRELGHLLTANFGVKQGMSGSGVITPQGYLAGVVSSGLFMGGNAKFYNDKGQLSAVLRNSGAYFMFTGFTDLTMDFIRSHISGPGRFGVLDAVRNGYALPASDKKFDEVVLAVDTAEQRN